MVVVVGGGRERERPYSITPNLMCTSVSKTDSVRGCCLEQQQQDHYDFNFQYAQCMCLVCVTHSFLVHVQ